MKFSIVVPVFNEKDSLEILFREIKEVMKEYGSDYEIIFVDDGSSDGSYDVLKSIFQDNKGLVRLISFKKNCGQSTALYAGFKEAKGEWIITLDGDLQNPPKEILKLIDHIKEADFVTGVRKKREDTLLRKLYSWIGRTFRRIILQDRIQDVGCSLRVFRREIVDNIPFFKNFHRFFPYLVQCQGFTVKEIDVEHRRREFGKSKYSGWRRAKEGLFDLIGVFWLRRRLIKYEVRFKS